MIKIRAEGNTTIRIASGPVKMIAGVREKWTVYPYPDSSAMSPEEQDERLGELSISGFKPVKAYTDRENRQAMNGEIAAAIARLERNLGLEQYKGLGLTVDEIDIEPEGEIAGILEREYGIRPIERESQVSPEVKG